MRVTVFLKTPLFNGPHVPRGACVLLAELLSLDAGAMQLQVDGYQNADGKSLTGDDQKLLVPLGKVDHVLYGA